MNNLDLIYAINDEFVRLGVSQDFYLQEGLSCEKADGTLVICSDHRAVSVDPAAALLTLCQLTPPDKVGCKPAQVWRVLLASSTSNGGVTEFGQCA